MTSFDPGLSVPR